MRGIRQRTLPNLSKPTIFEALEAFAVLSVLSHTHVAVYISNRNQHLTLIKMGRPFGQPILILKSQRLWTR